MTINDIIALANAGFSKSDINVLMQAGTQAPATVPVQTPATVPVQTPATVPVQTPATVPVQTQATVPVQTPEPVPQNEDGINKMLAEMSLLRQEIQSNNIINSQQPKVDTAEDIIAKIINPPTKERIK